MLKGGGGNSAVFITSMGVVVVDTKNPGWGQPLLDQIKAICGRFDPISLKVSQSAEESLAIWKGRKGAFGAVGRISPDYMCMDSTIPRKRLADILLAIQAMEQRYGLRCANVFHAGDGNLHPLILFDANQDNQFDRAEAFGADDIAAMSTQQIKGLNSMGAFMNRIQTIVAVELLHIVFARIAIAAVYLHRFIGYTLCYIRSKQFRH